MPENKRIANTGLRAGDEFMLEGILSFSQTKRPRKNSYNATQYEFLITLAFDAAHPIQVHVDSSLPQAEQDRIRAAANQYILNAAKHDKQNPSVSKIYLSKKARFVSTPDFNDYNDVVAKVDPKSMIPTLKESDNGYEVYEGNDPAQDTNPVSRVIINVYEYRGPQGQTGITDGIQYILYPKDMVPFAGGGGMKSQIEKFGVHFNGTASVTPTAPAQPAPATNTFAAQPAPAPTPEPTPSFGANPFGAPAGTSPFATPQDSPFGNN